MEDDGMQALGFMFDSEHEKTFIEFVFRLGHTVRIKTIGENPGHKQSGQYVWPAAKAIADYIIDHKGEGIFSTAKVIVELGAGCGIGGIVASQCLQTCESVVLTDYDPGALSLVTDNIYLNGVAEKCRVSFLEWGNLDGEEMIALRGLVDLIIGADLIYSKDVVRPLLQTVKGCLSGATGSMFLLVTSFALGEVSKLFIDLNIQNFTL